MFRGRLVAVVDAEGAEKERIGLIMATGEVGDREEVPA
jgi:hypothetical protein